MKYHIVYLLIVIVVKATTLQLFSQSVSPSFTMDTKNPEITLTSPNGGETFNYLQLMEVAWTASDDSFSATPIGAGISTAEGGAITWLAEDIENSGTTQLDPPDITTDFAKAHIKAVDAFGNEAVDASDDYLAITEPCEDAYADAGSDQTICEGQPVDLYGEASNYINVYWTTNGSGTFENENSPQSIYYPSDEDIQIGQVLLCLDAIAQAPCTDASDCMALSIQALPVVDAGPDQTVLPQVSIPLSGNVENCSNVIWFLDPEFGFIDHLHLLNANYYMSPHAVTTGSAEICLQGYPVSPCEVNTTDCLIVYIDYEPEIEAEFSASPLSGAAPLEVHFTDLSTGGATYFYWDFNNDGITDSWDQNPIFTYNEPGEYSVSLKVEDQYGSPDTETKANYIIVGESLTADFIASETIVYPGEAIQFTDISTGDIVDWQWDFNHDGTIDSEEQNPIWTYSAPGIYTVSLTVFDDNNSDNEIKTDYIQVVVDQSFELNEGFQFASTNILPVNPDFMQNMTEVLDNLAFARNSNGDQLNYFAGEWQNGIGNWITTEGYLVKMNGDDEITITGQVMDPQTEIGLSSGFQFIAYLPQEPMDAVYAFGEILDNLEYARNSSGEQLIQFFGTWQNGIGDLVPGEGYLLKMSGNDELIYPIVPDGYTRQQKQKPEHFVVSGGNPAEAIWTVYIDPAFGEPGDEIGIFDGDLLVGSGMIESDQILDNDIPVFGNLYSPGNEPSIRVWRKAGKAEFEIHDFSFEALHDNAWMQNEFPAEDGLYSFVTATITGINEGPDNKISIYPNPAKDQVTVVSACLAGAEIEIVNQLGKVCLKSRPVESAAKLDVSGLSPGIYLISISCDDYKVVKKLVIE